MSRQINLYDPSFRPKKDWLSSGNLVLASLLAVLLVSLGSGAARWHAASQEVQAKSINSQLLSARTAFAALTSSISERKADQALVNEVQEMERNLQAAQSALVLLGNMTGQQERPVVGDMMQAFFRAGIDGLWLTGFVVSEGGKQLEIRGRMTDQALLPSYLRRLETEPAFQGRRFAALDMRGSEWSPPVPAATPVAAVDQLKKPESERWAIEFTLRTTDAPKTSPENGGAR